jgi:peptide deformylase
MIITDESLLRVKCEPVLLSEVDVLRSRLEMGLSWSAKNGQVGVGLACPQIAIPKQMAIIRIDGERYIDLVNAKITHKYHPFEFDGEGCLSFPGRVERTIRYREIVVENNLVEPYNFIATGFLAIVLQHEYDHLCGILLPDVKV